MLTIKDDPRKQDNLRGRVSFAKQEEANSRSTPVFINLANNKKMLDDQGFVPFGEVVERNGYSGPLLHGLRRGPSGGGRP